MATRHCERRARNDGLIILARRRRIIPFPHVLHYQLSIFNFQLFWRELCDLLHHILQYHARVYRVDFVVAVHVGSGESVVA